MVLDVSFESGISLQDKLFAAAISLIILPDKKLNPVAIVLLKLKIFV